MTDSSDKLQCQAKRFSLIVSYTVCALFLAGGTKSDAHSPAMLACTKSDVVRIAVFQDVYDQYSKIRQAVVGSRVVLTKTFNTNFDAYNPHARKILELAILNRAIFLNDPCDRVEYILTHSETRLRRIIADSKADISGTWISLSGTNVEEPHLQLIDPGWKKLDLYLRFWGLEDTISNASNANFLESRIVSSRQWPSDWLALQKVGFLELISAFDLSAMVRLLYRKRADYLLLPIGSKPPSFPTDASNKIIPYPDIILRFHFHGGYLIHGGQPDNVQLRRIVETGLRFVHREKTLFVLLEQYWPNPPLEVTIIEASNALSIR